MLQIRNMMRSRATAGMCALLCIALLVQKNNEHARTNDACATGVCAEWLQFLVDEYAYNVTELEAYPTRFGRDIDGVSATTPLGVRHEAIPRCADRAALRYFFHHELETRFTFPGLTLDAPRALREASDAQRDEAVRLAAATEYTLNGRHSDALRELIRLCDARACLQEADNNVARQLRKMLMLNALLHDGWLECKDPNECILTTEGVPALRHSSTAHEWARVLPDVASGWVGVLLGTTPARHSVTESVGELQRFRAVAIDGSFGRAGGVVVDTLLARDDMMDLTMYQFSAPASVLQTRAQPVAGYNLAALHSTLAVKQADYDNDGDIDLLVTHGAWMNPARLDNVLLRNDVHNGSFLLHEVDNALRATRNRWSNCGTESVAWADYDLDGRLDVYVACEHRPCQLWRNMGNDTWRDVAVELGVAQCGFAKGVAWGHYDDDGYPDIAIATYGGPNHVFVNNAGKSFERLAHNGLDAHPRIALAVVWADFNNDGRDDLLISSHRVPSPNELYAHVSRQTWPLAPLVHQRLGRDSACNRLYLNTKSGLVDATMSADLQAPFAGMGMNVGDIDNDGFLDVYFGTGEPALQSLMPNIMLRNVGGRRFEDVTLAGGFGHIGRGHGIGFVDANDDGHIDVFAAFGGMYKADSTYNVLFMNPGSENSWIKISLVGNLSNRLGQGARITVGVGDDDRTIHITQGLSASFGSSPVSVQHVGLGDARRVEYIRVAWPHRLARTQIFGPFPVRCCVRLREGSQSPPECMSTCA